MKKSHQVYETASGSFFMAGHEWIISNISFVLNTVYPLLWTKRNKNGKPCAQSSFNSHINPFLQIQLHNVFFLFFYIINNPFCFCWYDQKPSLSWHHCLPQTLIGASAKANNIWYNGFLPNRNARPALWLTFYIAEIPEGRTEMSSLVGSRLWPWCLR